MIAFETRSRFMVQVINGYAMIRFDGERKGELQFHAMNEKGKPIQRAVEGWPHTSAV